MTDLARVDVTDWLAGQASTDPSEPRQPTTSGAEHPAAVEQVTTLAEAMAEGTWPEIAATFEDQMPGTASEVKRGLASHFWCDLFVGLVMSIENVQGALQDIPDTAKEDVKDAILRSSMRGSRKQVTGVVVDIVLNRVWTAFKAAAFAQVPLLATLSRDDVLRDLRILAVFTCPAPGEHKEVREHALKPLDDEARRFLTDKTRARLGELFAGWRPAG
ncbi:MAG: hypothetical protein ACJ786_25800 [Catenulispora sp.]